MERQEGDLQEERQDLESSLPTSEASYAAPDDGEETEALAELIGEEAVQQIPPESRGRLGKFVSIFTSIGSENFNPMLRRITSEHISTILANFDRSSEREYATRTSTRRYQFLYFLIGILAAIGLIVFFSLTDDRNTLTILIVALLGFVGGFGVGRTTGRGG